MLRELQALQQNFSDWMYENITEHPNTTYPVMIFISLLILAFIYYLFKIIFEHCVSLAKLCGLL
ncbi:MAG TPA: hypothetical protein VJG90_04985 [Candidatus Nanoarchaeia archaeon]|nr:hypothetical protein [Candidatus Nanoarchaeia archaeon]